jgi:hypothetical protein
MVNRLFDLIKGTNLIIQEWMNVEKYNKPMAAVLGMYKTDFHVIILQSTIYKVLINLFLHSGDMTASETSPRPLIFIGYPCFIHCHDNLKIQHCLNKFQTGPFIVAPPPPPLWLLGALFVMVYKQISIIRMAKSLRIVCHSLLHRFAYDQLQNVLGVTGMLHSSSVVWYIRCYSS